jgi:hypothetical protein
LCNVRGDRSATASTLHIGLSKSNYLVAMQQATAQGTLLMPVKLLLLLQWNLTLAVR